MIRHTLPSGATAEIRNVADVTERARRPIRKVQSRLAANKEFADAVEAAKALKQADGAPDLTPDEQSTIAAGMGSAFDDLELFNDLLVAALVAGWSYDVPVSADACQDIPGRDLDALREICAPFMAELMPGFEPDPDPASPIDPSTV
jgi:hypothetical protein